MRKSISSMYFTTTAALLVASTAVLCIIQMYLVTGYFKSDKRQALSDVVTIATAQVKRDYPVWEWLLKNPPLARAVQENMELISETSATTIFVADNEGKIVLCSDGSACPSRGRVLPAKALAEAGKEDGYFETGNLNGLLESRA